MKLNRNEYGPLVCTFMDNVDDGISLTVIELCKIVCSCFLLICVYSEELTDLILLLRVIYHW